MSETENRGQRRKAAIRTAIAREGNDNGFCHIVLEGIVVEERMVGHDCRQIVGMHVPGDVCGLRGLAADRSTHNLVALSPVTYLSVQTQWLSSLALGSREIMEAIWREMSRQSAISAVWMANIGQKKAFQRVAHFICEMDTRLRMADRGASRTGKWLGTQDDLRAATGLSLVHLNKTIRRLEAEQVLSCGRNIEVRDMAKLEAVAGFDPGYLTRERTSLADMLLSRFEDLDATCFSAQPQPRATPAAAELPT